MGGTDHGGRQHRGGPPCAARAALLASVALAPLAWPAPVSAQSPAPALPSGGRVVAGGATITAPAPDQLRITQTTQRAAIDWQSFSVGQGGHVQFQQPSASAFALNRVTGPDASVIAGRISANGQVAIVNQSGIVFTPTARVDTAGLIASAAGITNDNFMAGRMVFDVPPRPGATVVNEGRITVAEGGLAALVAPQAANRGTIEARLGRVVIGGAETFALDLHGDGLISLEVARPTTATAGPAASNTGTISAEGGTVLITAEAAGRLVESLVEAGGTISARNGGRVAAAAPGGEARVAGTIDVASATGRGGEVAVSGRRVAIAQTGRIDASGAAGGGRVRLGGDVQGGGAMPRAERTTVAQGAAVRADATVSGKGGTVVVWADDAAFVHGTLSARGGPRGGDGGFIETSGLRTLSLAGVAVETGAPAGRGGTWLIDPYDLTIGAATANGTFVGGVFTPSPANTPAATLSAAALTAALQAGNVTITLSTASPGDGTGTITVASPVVWGTSSTLTLDAVGGIAINAVINAPSGRLVLSSATGAITQGAGGTIHAGTLSATALGDITLGNVANAIASLQSITGSGDVRLASAVPMTVDGAVTAAGSLSLSAPSITMTTGSLAAGAGRTLEVAADILAAAGPISAPGGRITLAPFTPGTPVQVGGAEPTAGILWIRPATLELLSAPGGTIQIGTGGGTGSITFDGVTAFTGTTLDLRSGGAVAQFAGSTLAAPRLSASGTSITLANAGNAIGAIAGASAAGAISIASSGAALSVEGLVTGGAALTLASGGGIAFAAPVSAAGALSITAAGSVTQAPGATLAAASLTASVTGAGSTIALGTVANPIGTLAGLSVAAGGGAAAFRSSGGLAVTGPVSAPGAVSLAAGAGLSLAAPVSSATTVSLSAAGPITQTAAGAITAPSLTLAATAPVASIDLGIADNAVDRLDGATITAGSGAFTFNTTTALEIAGPVVAPGPATITAGGRLTQTARIVATSLTVAAGADGLVLDRADNAFGELAGASSAGGEVTVISASDLLVSGPISGSEVTVEAAGGLSVAAGVSGDTVRLASGGGLTLTGPGVDAAGTVTLDGGSGVQLFAPVAGAQGIAITGGTVFATGSLTASAGDIGVTASGQVTLGGAVSGRNVSLGSGAALTTLPGATVTATTGTLAVEGGTSVALQGAVAGATGVTVTAGTTVSTLGLASASGDVLITGATVATGGAVAAGVGRTLAITAGAIDAAAALRALGGTVRLAPRTAGSTVWLGTAFGPGLTLSSATLSRVEAGAGTLAVGGATAAAIVQTVPLDLTARATTLSLAGTSFVQIAPLAVARVTIDTGGGAIGFGQVGNAIQTLGPVQGGAFTFATGTPLVVEGPVDAATVALTAGGAVTQGASATITTARLSGSAGSLALDGTAHAIGTLGPFTATAGDLALRTSGPLALSGPISTPGTLALSAGGPITAEPGAVLTAARLGGGASGGTTLDGVAHAIAALGPWTDATGGLSLRTADALSVTGPVALGGPLALDVAGGLGIGATVTAAALSATAGGPIGVTGDVTTGGDATLAAAGPITLGATMQVGGATSLAAAGPVTFAGALASAGALTIDAGGPVTQGVGSSVTTPLLSGRSSGGTDLAGPANRIDAIGPWDDPSGGLALATDGALSLAGPVRLGGGLDLSAGTTITQSAAAPVEASQVSAEAQGGISLTAPGNVIPAFGPLTATAGDVRVVNALWIDLFGAVTAGGTLALAAAGDIRQFAPIAADRLEASATGGIVLADALNAVRSLGDVVNAGFGQIRLATTTGLALDGLLAAPGPIDLQVGGAITQAAAGRVQTVQLSGRSSGGAAFGALANTVGQLAGWTNTGPGGFRYAGTGGLAVTAPIEAGDGTLALDLRGAGAVTIGADLTAGTAISVAAADAISAGAFTYSAPAIELRSFAAGPEITLDGGTWRASDRIVIAGGGDLTITGTMRVEGLPPGSRPTIVLSVRSGAETTGFVRPDTPGLPDPAQPTQIEGFDAPTGQTARRLALGSSSLVAPESALFLVIDGGDATGTIDVARLGLIILGGSTDLSGCVNGVCGPNAASLGRTTDASAEARLNNCPVSSPNCLSFPNTVSIVSSQTPTAPVVVAEPAAAALEIPLADVSDEEE